MPSVKKPKMDIPLEVKRVMDELDLEDEAPDEEQLEALEDIWLKAGEMGKSPPPLPIKTVFLPSFVFYSATYN